MSDSTYNYEGLDPKFIQKAKDELKENPLQVNAHISSLRRWVTSMPHLTCRTDDKFLLRFLRTSKFDQSRAQMLIDNFCTTRKSPKGTIDWFNYPAVSDPVVLDFLSRRLQIKLGSTDKGELVYLWQLDDYDTVSMPNGFVHLMRSLYMTMDVIASDEMAQIAGIILIDDFKGAVQSKMQADQSPRVMFQSMRNWQDAFPIRTKAMVFYNEPFYMDAFISLFSRFAKEKLRKRIIRLGSNLEKLRQLLGPNADNLLPPEYGGKNKPVLELVEDRKREFLSAAADTERELLNVIEVDESRRPALTKDYLKTFESSADPSMGISGTFTKLNVD